MNAQELEKLLTDVTPGPWTIERQTLFGKDLGYTVCLFDLQEYDENERSENDARLIALAPTLARRVIAAEKLADAVRGISFSDNGIALFAALAEWEAAQ